MPRGKNKNPSKMPRTNLSVIFVLNFFNFNQVSKLIEEFIPAKDLFNVKFVIKNSNKKETKRFICELILAKNHFNAICV